MQGKIDLFGDLTQSVHCQYTEHSMLIQTLYKNGNSTAVTIPKEYLVDLNLRVGSAVTVKKLGKDLVISSQNKQLALDVDQKFAQMVDEFINDHRDVLQELAKK